MVHLLRIYQRPRTLVARLSSVQEKNCERNKKRKQQLKLVMGLRGIITLTNSGGDLPTASNSASTKRLRESSSTQPTPTSNPKQKRGRIESKHAEQEETKRTSSYGGAVETSIQKLVVKRKGSSGHTPMVESDLRIVLGTINQMIQKKKLDFSVCIKKTFIHSGRVLLICYDKKFLEWAQEVVRAVSASTRVEQKGKKKIFEY